MFDKETMKGLDETVYKAIDELKKINPSLARDVEDYYVNDNGHPIYLLEMGLWLFHIHPEWLAPLRLAYQLEMWSKNHVNLGVIEGCIFNYVNDNFINRKEYLDGIIQNNQEVNTSR